MNFCAKHWDDLKAATELQGLMPFVSKDGEQAAQRIIDATNGIEDPGLPPDPLLVADFEMSRRCVEMGGPYIITQHLCPLCELARHITNAAPQNWINGCTAELHEFFVLKGWIKEPTRQ